MHACRSTLEDPTGDVLDVVEEVQRLKASVAALEAHAISEADARDLAKQRLHYGSTSDWLSHAGGLRRGEGRRLLRRAQALTGSLVRTREGMLAGALSPAQADVIVRTISDLPGAQHCDSAPRNGWSAKPAAWMRPTSTAPDPTC